MARETTKVVKSDLSGKTIAEGTGGTIRIRFADGTVLRADLTTAELKAIAKDTKAVAVGGKRAAKQAERAAAAAAAEEADEAADGEGGEELEDGEEPADEQEIADAEQASATVDELAAA